MKPLLSFAATLLMLIGCGDAAEKFDPIVKAGKIDTSSINVQNANLGGGM